MSVKHKLISGGFRILGRTGLSRALAPVTQGCGAVFMIHRVQPARQDRFQPNAHLEITPEFLRTTVERIRANNYEIISLDEAVSRLKSGYGQTRYAVLTFDDGYRDNLEIAYPLLKELEAPFTIFVASGLVDGEAELWWLALERIIAENDEITFISGSESDGIPCRTVEEKYACFDKIVTYLTTEIGELNQRSIIRSLADRYGVDLHQQAKDEMMSWDEVRQLAEDPLVTIGAHTHDHFALARLEAETAKKDIALGIERLEKELGQRPKHFAYPYGKKHTVSSPVADMLVNMGFASAVTTEPGVLQSTSARDTMKLPRVSLNGRYQDPVIIDQYLTGAPFALYKAASWARSGLGLKAGFSRLFPSTR